jgi:O-antigen ligase
MNLKAEKIWRVFFGLYGVLSLSFMAGMSIGGALFLAVTAFLLFACRDFFRPKLRALSQETFLWATAFFFFVCFASLMAAYLDPPLGEAAKGFKEIKKFHHFLYPVFVGWAFAYASADLERHDFWQWWGGMAVFLALVSGIQFFGQNLFPSDWLTHRFFRTVGGTNKFHGQGLMFFHLSFASCLSSVAAIGLGQVLWPSANQTVGWKWFWRVLAVAGFAAVFFSFSRIGFAAMAFLAVGLCFMKKPKWGLISLVLIALLGTGLWWQSESFQRRFLDGRAGVRAERMVMWQAAWEMFLERPHLGFGFARSGDYTQHFARKVLNGGEPEFSSHAHNNVLDALAATGWLGLLAYLLWFGYWIVSAWRSFWLGPHRGLAAGALFALLAFQVNGLTQVNFWDGKSQHTLMIICGLIFALKLKRKVAN